MFEGERERESFDFRMALAESKVESRRFFERRTTPQHWQPNFVFSTTKGLVVTLTIAGRLLKEAEGGFGRARLRDRHAGCLARYTGGEGSDFGKDKQDCTSWPSYLF